MNLEKLKPFTKFCCTIGAIPSSYLLSLTYEEQLLWLCNYLEKTVIPTINNNTEVTQELQNQVIKLQSLFEELQNYVNDYFNNLDITNEIDRKLDEMAEDGTLESIIAPFLNSEVTIMLGDELGIGIPFPPKSDGWCDFAKKHLNIKDNEYFKFVEQNSGFNNQGVNGHTFQQLLEANISQIPNPSLVKRIIVCGGYSDRTYTTADISNNIKYFCDYCKSKFPNADIYCGMIANYNSYTSQGSGIRQALNYIVLPAYQSIILNGGYYLSGVENILHNYSNFFSSQSAVIPNSEGFNMLGNAVAQSIKQGYASISTAQQPADITLNNSTSTPNLYSKLDNNIVYLSANPQTIIFTTPIQLDGGLDKFKLGNIYTPFFQPNNRPIKIPCNIDVTYHSSDPEKVLMKNQFAFIELTNSGTFNLHSDFRRSDFQEITRVSIEGFTTIFNTILG